MQTSINNSISLLSAVRMIDRSHPEGETAGRTVSPAIPKETTMQKRANWIATRGTARRSCVPSQWRMCEKITASMVESAPYRGNLDAVIADINAVGFRERIPSEIPYLIFMNSAFSGSRAQVLAISPSGRRRSTLRWWKNRRDARERSRVNRIVLRATVEKEKEWKDALLILSDWEIKRSAQRRSALSKIIFPIFDD